KNLLKGAAISAIERPGPLQDFYAALVEKGMRPSMARLTLARKVAAITLTMWKKGVSFDPKQLQRQAARASLRKRLPFEEFPLLVVGRFLEMLGSREVSVNEIWPRVPWAPSHSYHVMPPRITRNSYRPRASDRTMVDFESPF